jgi:hypothetical protein
MTEHRDAGWLAQLAEKDRQIQEATALIARRDEQVTFWHTEYLNQRHVIFDRGKQIEALQAAYEDTRDSLMRALAALAEHDARYRQQVQYHQPVQ